MDDQYQVGLAATFAAQLVEAIRLTQETVRRVEQPSDQYRYQEWFTMLTAAGDRLQTAPPAGIDGLINVVLEPRHVRALYACCTTMQRVFEAAVCAEIGDLTAVAMRDGAEALLVMLHVIGHDSAASTAYLN